MNNELVLKVDSKVISTNFDKFKKDAQDYLVNLNDNFETDEDFDLAKTELKELKFLEETTKNAIDLTIKSNEGVAQLITAAEDLVESFREQRLKRTNLIKEKKVDIRNKILTTSTNNILKAYNCKAVEPVKEALEAIIPQSSIKPQLIKASSNKKTLYTLNEAVKLQEEVIKSHIKETFLSLKKKLALYPKDKMYLFRDIQDLLIIIDIENIQGCVDNRLEEEQRRLEEEQRRLEEEQRRLEEEQRRLEEEQRKQQDSLKVPVISEDTEEENIIEQTDWSEETESTRLYQIDITCIETGEAIPITSEQHQRISDFMGLGMEIL